MENLPKEKETKRRFFRRTGLSRAQRSLDSSSPVPSHSTSLENNSIFSAAPGSHHGNGGIPASSSSCGFIATTCSSAVGGGQMLAGTHNGTSGNKKNNVGNLSSRRTGASNSLDETIISNKMDQQHRRFMAAPRRARSAERFDGMRIAYSNSPGGSEDMAGIRSNNFHSPQLARLGNSVTDVGRPGSNSTSTANGGGGQTPTIASMPSPPPPYTAVTDITGPPSYRQAVAAMTASAQQQAAAAAAAQAQVRSNGSSTGKAHPRYSMANRSVQSFDISGSSINGSNTLRSASSVPTFSDEVLCRCSKCQAFQRPNDCGEYNDAVYMESQAFLMHEIMTDGMAFCSVM